MKRKFVAVIGPSHYNCSYDVYNYGIELGKTLFEEGYSIVCGGLGGIMEAVCKGAKSSFSKSGCITLGIIPGMEKTEANQFCDIVIPSGLGISRNALVVNTADVIISVAGETGTLMELGVSLQLRKPIVVVEQFSSLASDFIKQVEKPEYAGLIYKVVSLDDLKNQLKNIYNRMPKNTQHK